MRLISLYIENFGGLIRYSLDFGEGLTVVEANNGFGKTTLAEFLRAMLFGFPRKGKTLDKSRRQKYTPWNGGKFGGNLVFEADGVRYRLERSFGATPKGDSFALIDLTTNKKSSRYSEEIGLELFGLDADAFERSTYLPQMAEVGNLTTDSIRSKLSNLVEDTNDVGNFEKAMAALKTRRSGYIPYRGSGGSVMQAQGQVSRLQDQLRTAEHQKPMLLACKENIGALEQREKELREESGKTRLALQRAAEAAAIAASHRQYAELARRLRESREARSGLEAKYPAGIPDAAQIEQTRQIAARLEMLVSRDVADPEALAAETFLEENRNRFGSRVPAREELDGCRGDCRAYFTMVAEAQSKGLSEGEKELYGRLKPLFDAGMLDKERLETLEDTNRKLTEKEHQKSGLILGEDDERKLRELEAYFAAGIPTEEDLRNRKEELEQLRQLRQERSQLTASAAQRPAVKQHPLPLMLLILLGVAATAAGIVLLVRQEFLWGGIGLGAGILSLIGAIFAGMKLMLARELNGAIQAEQELIRENREKIDALKQSLSAFAGLYTTNDMMGAALYEIGDHRKDYLALQAKQTQFARKREALEEEIRMLREMLIRELGAGDFGESLVKLRVEREQYLDLLQELDQAETEKAELLDQAEQKLAQIRTFLDAFGCAADADPHNALSELERSSDAYSRAAVRVQKWREEKQRHEQETGNVGQSLATFFGTFGMEMQSDAVQQLLRIRDDRKDWEEACERVNRLNGELEQVRIEHGDHLAQQLPKVMEEPAELRDREVKLQIALTECGDELLRKKQECRLLQEQVEQIPLLRDELQQWQEKKQEDQHRADLLDDTMAFLEQAKENLSVSYLGPIRRSFGGYMERLWGEPERQMLVDQNLDVFLERCGEARELGYFSAGQSDLVMLCMRFALVDALFGEEKPFVILDDPFVNLDDQHTKQALKLLKELAENRQILYLTCSTSRTPN